MRTLVRLRWGAHCCDQINRALGTDDTGPTEIVLESGVTNSVALCLEVAQSIPQGDMSNKDTGIRARGIQWLVSPRAKVAMKFAAGHQLKFHRDADWGPALGATFFGEKGQIAINRNQLDAPGLAQSKDNPGPNRRPETAYHIENWIECVKSRKTCNADIEIGQRASTLCLLINIARELGRVGETLKWDPVVERFMNCDEANKLLDRPRRKGYELPMV